MIRGNDPILLTPGPLTTSLATKQAMLRDWGSWDAAFNAITGSLCEDLVRIVHGEGTHVCVPMQGSGTFSVEAAMANVVPRDGKVLVPQNGAYCQRILKICKAIGRAAVELAIPEDQPASAAAIEAALAADPSITHVAQVHCETGAGVLNPLPEIAQLCARLGKGLIVDAMSSFGAIEIDARTMPFDALVAATGKCIEGVPGMGFVLVRKDVLEASQGNSHSLALDLYDQYAYMQKTTQWRFTPPTHVVAAFRAALDQYLAEGGQAVRGARYRRNCAALIDGMRELGFRPFLRPEVQAPIIVTFHAPDDPRYDFKTFYAKVRERGYILYPGKLTQVETFRVGCIGAIDDNEMRNVVSAIGLTLQEMGIDMAAQLARAA
ncbi:2-aminoethylphosphonate-pyruvate transaminase [Cupriavidus gilardii CR3]|uniref:2-aminoethylphosphonate--pyruvate transaminase n=1 Tax=Cupriavidus gilardii TaxID=82541 RepID=A0A849BET5_9BURK|nr:2-aminoethylphosphonate--pyruvate transaminase [Cupriavidus gilardii]ALD93331.1 2-aminoethylphosphonate-pyruvate transaminase [Cupriavidus gilardii CR3]KAB0599267.1 2-aminoethylphosphonate--pyruvate transaminase [Cupriavidus gilardii]MCT9013268.1 2-aminoethylphosphonate--pyruvate transaminase [Cupriavidus gilardii]MCT9052822.1 2-aminoethylphosphonate--pyruvate transaminase [Cupriavidus gilardii]NNH12866.1 2-aminoethylphosphonate--pyruvate transaminase [Cupriavidus gilardii]